jgi:hypothetical protein
VTVNAFGILLPKHTCHGVKITVLELGDQSGYTGRMVAGQLEIWIILPWERYIDRAEPKALEMGVTVVKMEAIISSRE